MRRNIVEVMVVIAAETVVLVVVYLSPEINNKNINIYIRD